MAVASRKSSGPVLRSLSPSGRFCYTSHAPPPSASAFASSTSSFNSRSSTFFHRRAAPSPRAAAASSASTVRFSLDRPTSPGRSISAVGHSPRTGQIVRSQIPPPQKRTCMCSPTNHPGSFRCSLHKAAAAARGSHATESYSPNNRLHARRSAMTNSLVRICGVEGDLVKRALAALIRPSSHQQRRRDNFRPRPSRLSVMSKAKDSSPSC